MDRTCSICNTRFDYPYLLKRHLQRKTPCVGSQKPKGVTQITDKPFRCPKCGHGFSQSSNMYRHKSKCVVDSPLNNLEDLKRVVEEQQLQIAALTAAAGGKPLEVESDLPPQISASFSVGSAVQTNNVHIHMPPVIRQEVHINYWGEEDLSGLDQRTVKYILDQATTMGRDAASSAEWLYVEVMRRVLADPEKPQNLTAYISNKREGEPIVHEATGWNRRPKSDHVYVPIVSRILDQVFINQPFDEQHELYGPILAHLRDNEQRFAANRVMPSLLETNKCPLSVIFGAPPPIGAPPSRSYGRVEGVFRPRLLPPGHNALPPGHNAQPPVAAAWT